MGKKLSKNYVENKYGVRLERNCDDMCGSYKSWSAYAGDSDVKVAWQYTLKELVCELDKRIVLND